jgi:hypothetical protein
LGSLSLIVFSRTSIIRLPTIDFFAQAGTGIKLELELKIGKIGDSPHRS